MADTVRSSLEGEGAPTDSLISVAARALAVGDVLGALNCVALRDDAPALALRVNALSVRRRESRKSFPRTQLAAGGLNRLATWAALFVQLF